MAPMHNFKRERPTKESLHGLMHNSRGTKIKHEKRPPLANAQLKRNKDKA
jgi:hypothetical protein